MAKPSSSSPLSRFKQLTAESTYRIIAASFGEVGTLKTSFWLTAPGPILIQSTDKGLEGVVDVYLENLLRETGQLKEIRVVEYDPSTTGVAQEEAEEVRCAIEEDFAVGLQGARTILWDKETQIYEICKYAEFGAPSGKPNDYYPLDQRYRHLINSAKDTGVNFGLIQGMKTPWVEKVNKKTGVVGSAPAKGERERRGMREIEELVHMNIEHALETDDNGQTQFVLKLGKSRGPGGRDIQNQTLPYMTFPELAMLVFPNSEPSDWE